MTQAQRRLHSLIPWLMYGLACGFYFYEFFVQVSPSVMVPELMREFHVQATELGVLTGVYFYSYSAMQLPVGVLLDRLGPRRLLSCAAAICGIASAAFGMTHSIITAEIARFAIGLGSAAAVVGAMKVIANWFTPDRFAFLNGVLISIGMLGAIGGESPLALAVHHIGWRESMLILALIGLAFAVVIALFLRDRPYKHSSARTTSSNQLPLLSGLKEVLKNKRIWLVAIYGGLMFAPLPTFCGLWGVPFLQNEYAISRPEAAGLVSLVLIGMAAGCPLWGWISNRIGRRLPPMIVGSIGALISLLGIIYIRQLSIVSLEILLFSVGFFISGFLVAFAIAKEIANPESTGATLGFMNMMNSIGIAILQPAIGYVLDYYWSGVTNQGLRMYQMADYRIALDLLALSFMLAIAILPFIKETYCQPINQTQFTLKKKLIAVVS